MFLLMSCLNICFTLYNFPELKSVSILYVFESVLWLFLSYWFGIIDIHHFQKKKNWWLFLGGVLIYKIEFGSFRVLLKLYKAELYRNHTF